MSGQLPHNHFIWWIEDNGRWLNFSDAYASRFPDCFFAQEEHRHGPAFDELGYVKVIWYPQIIDIHWDVRHVRQGALNSVLDHLLTYQSPGNDGIMVALKFYFGAWNSELYTSPARAIDRIIELNEYAGAEPSDSITIASIDIGNIGQSHQLAKNSFARWQEMGGVLGDDPAFGLGGLNDYGLLMAYDSLDEQLIYKSAGIKSVSCQVLGEDWRFVALGRTADRSFSDDEYEAEVCSDYPEVMESGVPRLDHIRAFYQLENEDPVWLNYERLLLPWKTSRGEPMVSCFSQLNQDLSVPFLEAAVDQAA